ncbi:MAG: hypothetical protein E7410_04090 [Ruminococcaceae bacterium]|nr:hypothetical protein [Oscillospiraceae bacterium]
MNSKHKKIDTKKLMECVLSLKTVEECEAFFLDLCTMSELGAMVQRLEVAQLLRDDFVYNDIAAKTGASSATISRVARCLNYGSGGYEMALGRTIKEDEDNK